MSQEIWKYNIRKQKSKKKEKMILVPIFTNDKVIFS